jgi:hypothetical protein
MENLLVAGSSLAVGTLLYVLQKVTRRSYQEQEQHV